MRVGDASQRLGAAAARALDVRVGVLAATAPPAVVARVERERGGRARGHLHGLAHQGRRAARVGADERAAAAFFVLFVV